ncbi:MAG: DUF1844 domain-containing protein, partial [Candidatus Zixiibacteriota bacterium]
LTGKVERNLEMAKNSIDMLEMIERKTKGNLSDDEAKTIERALYELRLNYVDEVNKDKKTATAGDAETRTGGEKVASPENGDRQEKPAEAADTGKSGDGK